MRFIALFVSLEFARMRGSERRGRGGRIRDTQRRSTPIPTATGWMDGGWAASEKVNLISTNFQISFPVP